MNRGPILACAESNVAVDNLLEGLLENGIDAIRIGRPVKVREALRDATLDARTDLHSDQAEIELLEALRIVRLDPDKNALLIGDYTTSLGTLEGNKGNYTEAIRLLNESVEIIEASDPTYMNLFNAYNNRGVYLGYIGEYSAAVETYDLAIEHAKRYWGETSPEHATALNSKGASLANLGELELSEQHYREALGIFELDLVAQQRSMASASNNLAMNLTRQGKFKEGEVFFKNAIDMQKNYIPGDSLGLVIYKYNLGFNYRFQHRYLDSQPLIMEAAGDSKVVVVGGAGQAGKIHV